MSPTCAGEWMGCFHGVAVCYFVITAFPYVFPFVSLFLRSYLNTQRHRYPLEFGYGMGRPLVVDGRYATAVNDSET